MSQSFLLTLPDNILPLLKDLARHRKTSVNALIRTAIETHYKIEMPTMRSHTVYSTPEERIAARRKQTKERNELIKALLKKAKAEGTK